MFVTPRTLKRILSSLKSSRESSHKRSQASSFKNSYLNFYKNSHLIAASIITLLVSPCSYSNDNLEKLGDQLQILVPVTAASISFFKDDYVGLTEEVEGALWTSAATHILKYAIDAERPDGSDNNSFPSGHTSAAVQGAAYLQFRYGWQYGLPAYIAGGVVGYSRVDSKHHYWRDVMAGAALATGIQYAISVKKISLTNLVVAPVIGDNQVGLVASANF